MPESVYTAHVAVSGGREGHATSDDHRLDISLARPGSRAKGTNPEQLFAAGFGACFQSAMGSVARQRSLDITGSTIEVSVSLLRGEGAFGLGVAMRVTVPQMDLATIQSLVDAAQRVCPYSNAIRGNIDVTFDIANGNAAS